VHHAVMVVMMMMVVMAVRLMRGDRAARCLRE